MIGILLVTHGKLAFELAHAVEHVVGAQKHFVAIAIDPSDNLENKKKEIADALRDVSCDKGVIICTDMLGGTPSNLALSLCSEHKMAVIAGINLPLLIKLMQLRKDHDLHECVHLAVERGRSCIQRAEK